MNIQEIEQYTKFSKSKSVCIDVSSSKRLYGYVRTVTIRRDCSVQIEFHVHNTDEGGPIFLGKFLNKKIMIKALEIYLEKPINEWINYSRSGGYPKQVDDQYRVVITGDILRKEHDELPSEGDFHIGSSYWANLLENYP